MRRSKIKPSINLASRRSVSTPSQAKDKTNVGTPTTPKAAQGTDSTRKPPVQDGESDPRKATRERRLSQTEKTDAASNKEVSNIPNEVVPLPTSLPLEDTRKEQDSSSQPPNVLKDSVEQSTEESVPTSTSTSAPPSGVQETGTKTAPLSVRRKRFSAVPNLGQPRFRPSSQRSEVTVGRASSEISTDQEQKENEEAIKRPPPVQRMLTVPTSNKKGGAPSPAIASIGPEVQKNTASKSFEATPVQNTPKASSTLTTKASEIQVSTDSTSSEVDGKKSIHHANVYSKKLKELKEQMNEETPSKRRKRHARSSSPDRAKMTMGDLIYYNPRTNRMKVSEAEKQNKKVKTENNQKKKVTFARNDEQVDEDIEDDTSSTTTTNTMAPQVKIGPDGEIIIDQSSLYVEASPAKTFDPSDSEVVHEDSSHTTYSSFRNRKRTAVWTEKDTRRFYLALSAVGTDFTTINAMFPARTRAEIKRKFKKEERQNRKKVDLALKNRQELDMSLFDPPSEESDVESVIDADKNKKSTVNDKNNPAKKNGQFDHDDITENMEEQSPELADVSGNGDLPSVQDSQDELEEQPNLANILSTTRSGRQPKVRTSFTIQIPPKLNRKRTRASPSQNPNALQVFDDYAKHRIQRLQQEHEATMTLKRLARNEMARDPEGESEDERSDVMSEMMSEVGSEMGNDEMESVEHAGLTNNLQPMRMLQRNSPLAGPSSNQLAVGEFSSPESINDPSVKKVTLVITTPDGKQTLVQVNLTSNEAAALTGSSGAATQGETADARLGVGGGVHTLPKPGPAQAHAGHVHSPQANSDQVPSPARTLTTLSNVSSPYQRNSPHNQKIRTVLSTGETQPSKQSKNVTMAKIVDGKIVFCPPQSATSPGVSRTIPEVPPVTNTNPSVQHGSSSTNVPHQESFSQSGNSLQRLACPEKTHVNAPSPTDMTAPAVQPPVEAPSIPVVTDNISTDNLLSMGSLPDLDMSMTFDGNLGMVACEESIETMGDHIVAQEVNVASTNADGVVPRKKHKLKPHEPFIPPIK